MRSRAQRSGSRTSSVVGLAAALTLIGGGIAFAGTGSTGTGGTGPSLTPLTFDGWASCPVADPAVSTCATVVVRGGEMSIGGLVVPIPDGSLKIAGGVKYETQPDGSFTQVFVPQPGTNNGVLSTPITIPGGVFGVDTPLGITQIQAQVEAVGLPSVDVLDLAVRMPVRLKLSNTLLGNNCYIGSASKPITFGLSTSGNPPSQPIGSVPGAVFPNVAHVDNSYAVPAASGCGLLGGLNWAVNLRANTPSASGNNELATVSDVYTVPARRVRPAATAADATERAAVAQTRTAG